MKGQRLFFMKSERNIRADEIAGFVQVGSKVLHSLLDFGCGQMIML